MFTDVKIREDIDDNKDRRWYQHPCGTAGVESGGWRGSV